MKHGTCVILTTSETVMRTVPDGSCQTLREQLSAVTAVWPRRQTEVTGQEWPDRVTTALEALQQPIIIILQTKLLAASLSVFVLNICFIPGMRGVD